MRKADLLTLRRSAERAKQERTSAVVEIDADVLIALVQKALAKAKSK